MTKLADRGFPPSVVELAKLGTDHHLCVPWMQATYIVVANKQALEHLPRRRAPRQLTYEHLAQWGGNIEQATGERELGFPAGPKGVGRVRPRRLAWARFAQAAG